METGEITEGLEWGSFDVNEQAAAQGANTGPSTVETELMGEPPELSLAGESVGPTHGSPSTGPVEEPSTPLGPWTHADNRREQELRQREIERLVVENARMRNAHMSDQEELRDARTRLEMQERERNVLESLARSSISGAGAGPTVVTEVRAPSGGKIAQPREYSPKGGVGPAKWLFHMDLYFKYAHVHEDDRVDHGVILLRDAAESWWRSHIVSTTDPRGNPTDGRLVTWTAFANCLKDVFTPIPEKERARSRLYDLKQTGSVQAYTALFREVTFVLDDLSPSEAFSLYKRGLKPKVWSDIRLQFPKTLEAVIALAEQADAEGSSVGPDRPTARSGTASGDRRPFIRRARQKGARLNVVEAGEVRRSGEAAVAAVRPPPRRPPNADRRAAAHGPAADDRDRLRREGRCFTCRQTGHLARDCPQGNGPRR